MDAVMEVNRWIHIVLGFAVLILFWGQVVSKKGSRLHIWQGRMFYYAGSVVALTAVFSAAVRLINAYAGGLRPDDNPENFAAVMFLGYLGMVTFVILQRAMLALKAQKGRGALWRIGQIALGATAMTASAALIAYAVAFHPPNAILLYALSPLGLLIGLEMIRFVLRQELGTHDWMLEHMDAMLGAGIAFHTAFAVFGARSLTQPLLAGTGLELIPWILPTLIGIPAISLWKRSYRRRLAAA